MRQRNRIRPINGNYTGKKSSRFSIKYAVPVISALLWLFCYAAMRLLPNRVVTRWFIPVSKVLSVPLKLLTGLFPFALLEVLLILLPIFIILLFFVDFSRFEPSERGDFEGSMGMIGTGVTTISVMMCVFHLMLGFGYYQLPLEQQLDFPAVEVDAVTLRATAETLAEAAAALRPQADFTGKNVSYYGRQFRTAYGSLAGRHPIYSGYAARPKGAILSVPMSYLGIGGMYSPFTCESIISTDTTPPSLAFTIAHEMAHSLQVAKENEANFSAFLACVEAEDPSIRYSGCFMGLMYTLSAYRRSDPDAYPEFYNALDEGIREDLRAYSTHVAQYDGWINDLHSDINDIFLKSNGQTAGVASYGLMVNLLVAWQQDGGGVQS